jgi:regulator of replication initiation timing
MSDTPRTDKLEKAQYNHICGSSNDPADLLGAACNEMADLCRELERELKGAVRQIDNSRSYKRVLKTENNRLQRENAMLREQILDLAKRMNGHGCSCSGCVDDELAANKCRDDILSNVQGHVSQPKKTNL